MRGARPIYLADLDKQRPCVLLTRMYMASRLAWVTIAPITSQIRGIPTEVPVYAGPETGLKLALVRQIGVLPASCEPRLTAALVKAFALTTDNL